MNCPKCGAQIPEDSSFCGKCGTRASSSNETVTRTDIHGRAGDVARGEVLAGKYRIVEELGRGGMGIVYRAEDMKLNRAVALKFLPLDRVESKEVRERFLVEARAAAALSHPNICTIHEIYDQEERPFIEMEFVEGQSLRARIAERAFERDEAVEIAIQVAGALEEAHQKGIVHRDIKSANIMLTEKGQAKVMDFGLAKVKGESLHTREGTTLGTAAYMSPEQARGEHVDGRTDLWSLGVVLYEMLSGRLPFGGERQTAVLYAVVHEEAKPLEGVPAELGEIVSRALEKDVKARYGSAAEMGRDLRKYQQKQQAAGPRLFRPKLMIPAAALLVLLVAAGGWWYYRQSKIRWAREVALPEIERLILTYEPGAANRLRAYGLAVEAEKYIPNDPALAAALERCSVRTSIRSEPPGASVQVRELFAAKPEWRPLGITPIEKIRLPVGIMWWKFEKPGYETVMAVEPTFQTDWKARYVIGPSTVSRVLDATGKVPEGMVRVSGADTDAGHLEDFFIDRYEVSNKQYKEFVDRGGYRERKFWKQPFVKDGKTLNWEEAMLEFRDQTGRPGPATWQAGSYLTGQADFPVSGVSWHEAAAYAEFAGKSLPTLYHWRLAAGQAAPLIRSEEGGGWLSYVSNFKGEGPAAVGSHPSMTAYGSFDMAGNVREWCWNETQEGRVLRGGAWSDAEYMTGNVSQSPAFDRSPRNGFRCILYPDPSKIPAKALTQYEVAGVYPDFRKLEPVSDAVFEVYRDQFSYDKRELNPHLEARDASSADWIQEKVVVDAAYGNEKLPIYVFLPKGSSPPYQAVIYFPGGSARSQPSSNDMEHNMEFEWFLSFIVKSGRAVLFPVYSGMFERRDTYRPPGPTREYSEYLSRLVRDVRRSADYLAIRPEIDSKKLAYMGFSWGGWVGPVILATEDRLQAGILVIGGLRAAGRPEAQPINYVKRVRVPTLMLNGRYDTAFPYAASIRPMFDLLGTPSADKRLVMYDTDHFVPRNEFIKETLAWLDKYLGPVK